MNYARYALFALSFLVCCAVSAQPDAFNLNDANWIWHPPGPGEARNQYNASTRYFRTEFSLPESPTLQAAEIGITCDNAFILYLNGKPIAHTSAEADAWNTAQKIDLASMLSPGKVVLAVEAANTLAGPAGLLLKLVVTFVDGHRFDLISDDAWKSSELPAKNWEQPGFNDQDWSGADVLAPYGAPPWGALVIKEKPSIEGGLAALQALVAKISNQRPGASQPRTEEPDEQFVWPVGIVFVGNDCSLYRPVKESGDSALDSLTVTIFNSHRSRAFPEHDLPAPLKIGRSLMKLEPAGPGSSPQTLYDAGKGALGAPSVSFDGEWIYLSMAREGDAFFHIYKISAHGGEPEQLTDGPFFDIEPAELPDGRIVFVSTRVGTFEEYHSPPARALYVMNPDGSEIQCITNTIIFDNEPEVLADGRILFIRSDNFFDRGKVETLLHAVFPDGSRGDTEFGLENAPEYGNRLRANYCGSPAPMPDGRVAFLTNSGISIGRAGHAQENIENVSVTAGDVSAMPDGRLLCTVLSRNRYDNIHVLDVSGGAPVLTKVFQDRAMELHSPVFLGPRAIPPVQTDHVPPPNERPAEPTGTFICQSAFISENTTAGWEHVKAIRVLAGTGLTTRSSHSYIVHAGNETIELGTVPLMPDGSFAVEVPADTPIAFQAVDAEGRSELNEMSWIYVRPGERRSCVGCHQSRQSAPIAAATHLQALSAKPLMLAAHANSYRFRGNNAAVTGLMELQFDRFREVAGINGHDNSGDDTLSQRELLEKFILEVENAETSSRVSAAQNLALRRDKRATPALINCLSSEARELRVAAVLALAACGTRDAIPPLLNSLSDPDPLVAQAANIALENLTAHACVQIDRTRKQPDYSSLDLPGAWNRWFDELDWDQYERHLANQIETGDRDAIRAAAVALSHIGTSISVDALMKYLRKEETSNPYPEWQRAGNTGDNARFNATEAVNPRTLQAVVRAIGQVGNSGLVPELLSLLKRHSNPNTGNLFLAEALAEAIGNIGTPEAEAALIGAFKALKSYHLYTRWYGDHDALMSCHASPVHFYIIRALDQLETRNADTILADLIRSIPIDPDRALMFETDDYESAVGHILRRHDKLNQIVETCLSILGESDADSDPEIRDALSRVERCWAGEPGPEIRAAQVLSIVCREKSLAPLVYSALARYSARQSHINRVFNTGIPIVNELPVENWVSFYLARTLGYIGTDEIPGKLTQMLEASSPEASSGRPDPLGPGVIFLHNALTPCWRAAVAWAIGRLEYPAAIPVLLAIVRDLDNATDTRHAAATALAKIADDQTRATMREIAADYPERSTRQVLLLASNKSLSQE